MSETNGAVETAPARTGIMLSGDTKRMSLIPSSFNDILALSKHLANSSLIPSVLRGKPDDVAIIIATGLEFGLSPFVSLRQIYVVEGRPSLSADALVSVAMRDSTVCEYFTPIELTAEKAVYETKRKGAPAPIRMAYTLVDAQRAGLTGKPNWKLNQIGMLANRCKSTLAKAVYADLLLGMPSEEDARDDARTEREINPTPERVETGKTVLDQVKTAKPKKEVVVEAAKPEPTKPVEVKPEAVTVADEAPPHDETTGEVLEQADADGVTPTQRLIAEAIQEATEPGDIVAAEAKLTAAEPKLGASLALLMRKALRKAAARIPGAPTV